MDDQGNVYVADTLNLAIRKISDSGINNTCLSSEVLMKNVCYKWVSNFNNGIQFN